MSDIPMRRPLTDEQIPLVGGGKIHWPYGPDIPFLSPDGGIGSRFDHGSSAVIATLREKDAEIARLTSRLEEAREAGRKVVDIWLKTDDSYVNFGSLMLDLQEAVIADTKQSKDGAHHHRQRGRDSDMKCPSCGALAEVPGHYSWCKAQPSDSASEEQDEGRTPDQSWIVALHNLRICADELHRIGHVGEARMIEDAVNRIVAFRQHIAARARAEVVEKVTESVRHVGYYPFRRMQRRRR